MIYQFDTSFTHANRMKNDPQWTDLKQQFMDLIQVYQNKVDKPKAAEQDHQVSYQEALDYFGHLRGGSLYYPYLGSGLGNGALVELADGSVKYDLISGIGVHVLGHNHPSFVEAAFEAATDDTIMQGNLQQNVISAQVAEKLLGLANRKGQCIDHCFLSSSGAMANENALKLAFHAKPGTNRILAFENCFAGRSMALSYVTDRPNYRVGLPLTLNVDFVPFYDYQNPQSTERTLYEIERHIKRYPEQYSCFWMELVQGEGGYYVGDKQFFKTICALLRDNDIPIIIDEVQTFGRTHEPFAFQNFELQDYADIVTVGKMTQVCATLYKAEYKPKPGLISQTFTSSSSALRAALALFEYFETKDPFGAGGEIAELHQRFIQGFEEINSRNEGFIQGPHGIGTLIAMTPLDGSVDTVKKVLFELFDKGIIGFLNGSNPARIRFIPPLDSLDEKDFAWIFQTLEECLKRVAREN